MLAGDGGTYVTDQPATGMSKSHGDRTVHNHVAIDPVPFTTCTADSGLALGNPIARERLKGLSFKTGSQWATATASMPHDPNDR